MKYKTEFSSIHFEDQSFEADEQGVIEGFFPQHIVDFYKLELIQDTKESDEKKEEKKSTRKSKKDTKEGE